MKVTDHTLAGSAKCDRSILMEVVSLKTVKACSETLYLHIIYTSAEFSATQGCVYLLILAW